MEVALYITVYLEKYSVQCMDWRNTSYDLLKQVSNYWVYFG
jgi:hypothetical protein